MGERPVPEGFTRNATTTVARELARRGCVRIDRWEERRFGRTVEGFKATPTPLGRLALDCYRAASVLV